MSMSREVVRRFKSDTTHVADVDVDRITIGHFIQDYRRPADGTVALCGVKIKDGVIMREGSSVRCRACRHLNMSNM